MTQQADPSGWDVATKLEHSHGGVPCVATAEIRRLQAENEALRTALAQHYIDQRAKELPELPEPDVYEYDIETAMNVLKAHSPDQLQSYGAACAAHARDAALGALEHGICLSPVLSTVAKGELFDLLRLKKVGKWWQPRR